MIYRLPKHKASLLALLALAGCGASIHDVVGQNDLERATRMLDEDPGLVDARTSLPKGGGRTPLHYAVTYGAADLIGLLVSRGADVNAADDTGLTPLHAAAMISHTTEAGLLIEHGADLEARDKFGDTPFFFAAMHGQVRMLDFLLKAGADPYAENNEGLTPLDAAQRNRKESAADYLRHIDDYDD